MRSQLHVREPLDFRVQGSTPLTAYPPNRLTPIIHHRPRVVVELLHIGKFKDLARSVAFQDDWHDVVNLPESLLEQIAIFHRKAIQHGANLLYTRE